MGDYEHLERDAEQRQKIRDHSAAWSKLTPLGELNGSLRERVEQFAAARRISLDSLEALGTRVQVRHPSGEVRLAWASVVELDGRQVVTALKFRQLTTGERDALAPSVFLEPLIVGKGGSLDWFVAEGETDGARLYGLVGESAAVLVLPAGALTFKRAWADLIPRGATIYLGHDADEAGDRGAAKAAKLLGARTVRLRPPVEGGDWCDWPGGREEFLELVQSARADKGADNGRVHVASLENVEMREVEYVEKPLLQRDALILLGGRPGIGKGALCAYWLARCSNGEMYGQPRNAIVIASEDSDEIDLKPRLVVAGGEPARVFSVKGAFRLPGDALWLLELAERIGDVGLVVIDPVGNHTGEANTDRESDVRQALMPLVGVALELRCPLVGVRHVTTKASSGSAVGKILGSTAWIAVPRAVLVAALDAQGVLHVRDRKANRVPAAEAGLSYRIERRFPPGFSESVAAIVPLGASMPTSTSCSRASESQARTASRRAS